MMTIPLFWRRIIALVVLVLLFVGVYAWQRSRPADQQWGSSFWLWSPIIGPGDDTEASDDSPVVPAVSPDYGETLNEFGDRRFQFADCHGTPGSITVKRGTVVMLDNRDDESHEIAVGSRAVTIGAYGFYLYTANEVGELNVTCDGGGAATLKVQP